MSECSCTEQNNKKQCINLTRYREVGTPLSSYNYGLILVHNRASRRFFGIEKCYSSHFDQPEAKAGSGQECLWVFEWRFLKIMACLDARPSDCNGSVCYAALTLRQGTSGVMIYLGSRFYELYRSRFLNRWEEASKSLFVIFLGDSGGYVLIKKWDGFNYWKMFCWMADFSRVIC